MVDVAGISVILLNGLSNGMLLFMIAVGLTIIFGVLGVINFAHGSFYMLGAYFTYFLAGEVGTFYVAVVLGVVGVAVVGGVIERVIIRPIYDHDHIFQLLLTFAIVLVIDNGARMLWGTDFRSVAIPKVLNFQVNVFGRGYPMYNLFLIAVGAIVAVAMWLMFDRTRFGKIVQAASQDRETANALGINVSFVFTAVFILGSALAGFGGALAAPYRTIHPAMGEFIIIESFIIVIIGGLGSFRGALVGALLLGLSHSVVFALLPSFETFVPFALLAVVILLRPAGIFGEVTT